VGTTHTGLTQSGSVAYPIKSAFSRPVKSPRTEAGAFPAKATRPSSDRPAPWPVPAVARHRPWQCPDARKPISHPHPSALGCLPQRPRP